MKTLEKGFTLIELLTVVLIVAILTGVALPQYRKVVEKSHVTEAQALLRTIYDSSERLAGEFGYDSYADLVSAKGAEGYSFARMDMFDADNLPFGCRIPPNNSTVLLCKERFIYTPLLGHYVAAKKLENPYAGTLIVLDRNTNQLYCQEATASADACDVFGLDTVSGLSF